MSLAHDPYHAPPPGRPGAGGLAEALDWRMGLVFLVLSSTSLLIGGQTCSNALPVCTGIIWVALWGVGTLGLLGMTLVQAIGRFWGRAALSLLFLAGALGRPIWEALTT